MKSTSVQLTVVLITLEGGRHLERCLEALSQQEGTFEFEVTVAHDDTVKNAKEIQQRFPKAKFMHRAGTFAYAELRTNAVREARTRIVAITEDQCIPPKNWCANILAEHANAYEAIGGPVEKYRPDGALNWAIYLRELGGYMPPLKEGPTNALTDCNVTYKREALLRIKDVWATAFNEHEVHEALRSRGGTLWLSPRLLTYQQRSMELGPAMAERYRFGRLYGAVRAKSLSFGKLALLIAATPLLPVLFTGRVMANVVGKRRNFGPCLTALPYLVLFSVLWSYGEMAGYVTRQTRGGSRA